VLVAPVVFTDGLLWTSTSRDYEWTDGRNVKVSNIAQIRSVFIH
jgi:hypothetical protein